MGKLFQSMNLLMIENLLFISRLLFLIKRYFTRIKGMSIMLVMSVKINKTAISRRVSNED